MTTTNLNQPIECLFVSDLPFNTDAKAILDLFGDFAPLILDISFKKVSNPKTDPVLSCFVNFRERVVADKARQFVNMKKIRNKAVRVTRHEKNAIDRYRNENNIHVSNIPVTVTPRQVYEFFLQFGDIKSIKMPERDNVHCGYGYISYFEQDCAENAIKQTNDKEIWGSELKVSQFISKNERNSSYSQGRNAVFVKGIDASVDEDKLKSIFSTYGKIIECSLSKNLDKESVAKIIFEAPESAIKAVSGENGKTYGNTQFFVDVYKSAKEREMMKNGRRYQNSLEFAKSDTNVVVKGIPFEVDEEKLKEVFSQFGQIQSVNISKVNNVIKQGGEFVTKTYSKGYGFVNFATPEQAQGAIAQMNGKTFPGYETARPMTLEMFKSRFTKPRMNKFVNPEAVMQPMQPGPMMQPMHFNLPPQMVYEAKEEKLDMNYLKNMDDVNTQREYLGEFLYKKIESHQLVISSGLKPEDIGKITGMILGIEDIREICDIAEDDTVLSSRIEEALNLMTQN